MTALSCERVEDLLFEGHVDAAVREHIVSCASCRELAEGLLALGPAGRPGPDPDSSLVARARSAAVAEMHTLARDRRRADLVAGAKVLAGFLLALPLVLLMHAAVASVFEVTVGTLLSGPVLVAAEIAGFVASLASLSVVAFLLTLAAGTAARRRPLET